MHRESVCVYGGGFVHLCIIIAQFHYYDLLHFDLRHY